MLGRFRWAPLGIGQIPALRQFGRRVHQLHAAALLPQQSSQPRHGLAARRVGIGPERHRPTRQRLPVGLGDGVGAVGPADHNLLREQQRGCIGRALTFHYQHRCLGAFAQARQAIERPGCQPFAGEGIAAAGPMPAAIEPHAMQKSLAAAAARA